MLTFLLRRFAPDMDSADSPSARLRCGMVAAALGISRSYVSRIEKKALEKLRRAMEGD